MEQATPPGKLTQAPCVRAPHSLSDHSQCVPPAQIGSLAAPQAAPTPDPSPASAGAHVGHPQGVGLGTYPFKHAIIGQAIPAQIIGPSEIGPSLGRPASMGAQMGQLQGGGPFTVPLGQLGRTQAAVQTVGPSARWASSIGASNGAPASGGGAQVGQPHGEVLGKVRYWHAGRRHMIGGQMVVPPVPPFQPPEPPAELPEPPAMPPEPLRVPPVIIVMPPPLAPPPDGPLPPPPTAPPLLVVVVLPLPVTPPVEPPPLVPSPPAPPVAEPPLLEPPAPLDGRPESLVQLAKSDQATIRIIRLVNIVRIVYPTSLETVYSKACASFSMGPCHRSPSVFAGCNASPPQILEERSPGSSQKRSGQVFNRVIGTLLGHGDSASTKRDRDRQGRLGEARRAPCRQDIDLARG
jgi:hypothetical protein